MYMSAEPCHVSNRRSISFAAKLDSSHKKTIRRECEKLEREEPLELKNERQVTTPQRIG